MMIYNDILELFIMIFYDYLGVFMFILSSSTEKLSWFLCRHSIG